MAGKCNNSDCSAPDVPCYIGNEDCTTCQHFVGQELKQTQKVVSVPLNKSNIPWSGEAFSPATISQICARSNAHIIGVVGKADSGKTSFLAMLYTLLLSGRSLKQYHFCGSRTILSWDELYHRLKVRNGSVSFPPPTPATSNKLYHLGFRTEKNVLRDLLFADASGEVFLNWGIKKDDETADSARWIYSNANAFLFFIDCAALIEGKNRAKSDIMLIARQLSTELGQRPVVVVWSKADKKAAILPAIITSIQLELKQLFSNFMEIEISNFLEPGPDELVHTNNLAAVDWLLEALEISSQLTFTNVSVSKDDFFLNFSK